MDWVQGLTAKGLVLGFCYCQVIRHWRIQDPTKVYLLFEPLVAVALILFKPPLK